MSHRSALTRPELVVVIAIITLLLAILMPAFHRNRELGRRNRCASNLKGLSTGFYTFGDSDEWPRTDWPPHTEYLKRQHTGWPPEYTQAIGSYRSKDLSEDQSPPEKLSTTRGLWQLVRVKTSTPTDFICPSSRDIPSGDPIPPQAFDFGEGKISGPATPDQAAKFWHQVSYGYQIPFGERGRPSSDREQGMILMADKGPFGANIDAGMPAPPAFSAKGDTVDWRPWNSPNHNGEGQTVLYADSHAEFLTTPLTPANSDNIYTRWSNETDAVAERSHGLAPAPGLKLVPLTSTDSLLYP